MEEVAVMIPAVVNNDELSDETESINLDLHVSDTEDSPESVKKCDDQTESEEDILNKYIKDCEQSVNSTTPSEELKKSENPKPLLPNGKLESAKKENHVQCNGDIGLPEDIEDDELMDETLVKDVKANEEATSKDTVEDSVKDIVAEPQKVDSNNDEKKEEPEQNEVTLNGLRNEEESSEEGISKEAVQEEKEEKVEDIEMDSDEKNCVSETVNDENVVSEKLNVEKMDDSVVIGEKIDVDTDEKMDDSETVAKAVTETMDCEDSTAEEKKTDDQIESPSDSALEDVRKETTNEDSSRKDAIDVNTPKETADEDSPQETADVDSSKPTTNDETKTDNVEDNDELLCVMDEKSLEEANEHKDENSCSASEKDDEAKENEEDIGEEVKENDNEEENNEETRENDIDEDTNEEQKDEEEMNENNESQQSELDLDATECAMDIEESDIGGVVYDDTSRILKNDSLNIVQSKSSIDKDDDNKENEHNDSSIAASEPPVADKITDSSLTNGITEKESSEDAVIIQDSIEKGPNDEIKKTNKRQLSDSSPESGETAKKQKLETDEPEEIVEPEKVVEKRTIKILGGFKKFMLDKKLKKLTRHELEELCMQKMCECIVNKSEIGELRQKVLIQEQTIEVWRKEAIVVAKQTRDLKIVHERLISDLRATKEQLGKPLIPVKITRSVGLQAILENPSTRMRQTPMVNGPSTQQRTTVANNQQPKNVPANQVRQQSQPQSQALKPKVPPQRVTANNRPLQPINQKDNVNNAAKPRAVTPSIQNKKNTDPKTVIDLTDEDEKNQNAKQTTTNTASPTVRILNKQNVNVVTKPANATPTSTPSKIMFVSPSVLPRNSAVMVKMNSNGLVSPQNGLTTIPNGQVSVVTTPVVRTVSQVRVPVTTVTTVTNNVRTATPANAKTIMKHPAPLPAAPIYQNNIAGKKPVPPKPTLNLTKSSCGTGIVLQWKMPPKLDSYETIVSYQLYAYQETKSPPKTDNWGKIGDVKALELPMAVTLTQFAVGNRYFFAVRAVDCQKRLGPFSDPENILL